MKVGELVTQILNRIEASGESIDLPVIVATQKTVIATGSAIARQEPTRVEVQRVCHNAALRQCDAPRCESAFMALVIT